MILYAVFPYFYHIQSQRACVCRCDGYMRHVYSPRASHFVIGLPGPAGQRTRPRPPEAPTLCSRLSTHHTKRASLPVEPSSTRSYTDSAISRHIKARIGGDPDLRTSSALTDSTELQLRHTADPRICTKEDFRWTLTNCSRHCTYQHTGKSYRSGTRSARHTPRSTAISASFALHRAL
jgi:hypothetical protein